ncbi:FHA domain-containing protein FhaB/FipA [Lysinibacter cavernae]|uniref:PSer/pThr/pTyr-binding forkhead associated (FHA) protein n=1 Tax=Lysinibacter cavernae TaxID=1640652 RepID=A0A7X5TUK9_9MICO|nr:pSer/pThr/pTyr-binding forkhead associated (FHA) protein [Lysinibacter cavernae]
MSELTLLVLRLAFLLVLWGFVFAVVYALKSDLFGAPVRKLKQATPNQDAAEPQPYVAPVAATPLSPSSPDQATNIISTVGGPSIPSAAPSGPASRLVITSGPKSGVEVQLSSDPLTIGRSSESSLVIRDEYTSTHHARLVLQNGQWILHDLDSTNGTFLDNVRVTRPVAVSPGSTVTIGKTSFELRH